MVLSSDFSTPGCSDMHHMELFLNLRRKPKSYHYKGFWKTLTFPFSVNLRQLLMCVSSKQFRSAHLRVPQLQTYPPSQGDRLQRQKCSFYFCACCPLQAANSISNWSWRLQASKLQLLLQKTFSKGKITSKIPGLLTKHSRVRKEDGQNILKLWEKSILICGCQETEEGSPCLMSTLWSKSGVWAPFLYSQRDGQALAEDVSLSSERYI